MKPKSTLRRRAGTALLGALALTPGVAHWVWTATRPVEIPSVSVTDVSDPVYKTVEAARDKVRQAPHSDEAWGHLGMIFLAHGLQDEAEFCLQVAAEGDPDDPRWPYLLIPEKGSLDPAAIEQQLRRVVSLDARPPVPRLRLAEVLWKQDRFDEAEGIFSEVAKQYPKDGRAQLGLGRLAFARGDLEESRRHLEKAVSLAPAAVPVHQLLAQVYQRLGESQAARDQLARLESLPPNWKWPDPWWGEVARRSSSIHSVVSQGARLREAGRFDEAVELLSAASRKHPDSPELLVAHGMLLIDQKDGRSAEGVFVRAIEIAPTMVVPYLGLGHALALQNRCDTAIKEYRRALEIKPNFAEAHLGLGQCLVRSGRLAEAMDVLATAIRYNPNLIDAHLLRGAGLMDLQRFDEAEVALASAARLNMKSEVTTRLRDELAVRRTDTAIFAPN